MSNIFTSRTSTIKELKKHRKLIMKLVLIHGRDQQGKDPKDWKKSRSRHGKKI